MGVAIDPSGRRVAIGYFDEPYCFDPRRRDPGVACEGADGDLDGDLEDLFRRSLVTRRRNARRGWASSSAIQGEWRVVLRRFDAAGRREGADVAASNTTIKDIQPCGDGFAFAAARSVVWPVSPGRESQPRSKALARRICATRWDQPSLSRPTPPPCALDSAYREGAPVVFDLVAASADGFGKSSVRLRAGAS